MASWRENNDRELFDRFQRMLLAPVFAGQSFFHELHTGNVVLPYLECPVLLLRSARDNVVGSASAQLLTRSVPKGQIQEVILRRSQHVATLDYDAELLQRRIIRFIGEVSASPAG